jgi:hypothetical protein
VLAAAVCAAYAAGNTGEQTEAEFRSETEAGGRGTGKQKISIDTSMLPLVLLSMPTGKSKTNKSYKLGVQYARADLAQGLPRNPAYRERWDASLRGEALEYRPFVQPRGYYASEIERGYQETYAEAEAQQHTSGLRQETA